MKPISKTFENIFNSLHAYVTNLISKHKHKNHNTIAIHVQACYP